MGWEFCGSSMDLHLDPSRDLSVRLGIGRGDGNWMPWVGDVNQQGDPKTPEL